MGFYLSNCSLFMRLKFTVGTSLVVQWVRLHAPNAGGPCSIPSQGTRSRMHATTKISHVTTKSPHAATKSPHATLKKILQATTKTQHSLNK